MVIIPEVEDLIAIRAVIQRLGAIPRRKVTLPRGVTILHPEALLLLQVTIPRHALVVVVKAEAAAAAVAEVVVVHVAQVEEGNYYEK